MDQDTTVNNALRDLKFRSIIREEDSKQAQAVLEQIWTAGMEFQREKNKRDRQGQNTRIIYFGENDENLGTYDSIAEAERILEIPRKTICNSLYHSTARMRNGHYFEYADNGDNRDLSSDASGK